jgi:hypothetical protein
MSSIFVCPVEVLMLILVLLSTRELIPISLTCKFLCDVTKDERKRRQNINRLLSMVVNDVDSFRHIMHATGSILVGDFAKNFFTEAIPVKKLGKELEIFSSEMDFEPCLKSWFAFFEKDSKFSDQTLNMKSDEGENVCSLAKIRFFLKIVNLTD